MYTEREYTTDMGMPMPEAYIDQYVRHTMSDWLIVLPASVLASVRFHS